MAKVQNQMKQKILLTGDDGYNSVGMRILINVLRDKYDLFLAGTKHQQSGVGGKINMSGGEFKETSVDGVSGFYVDGSPVDAVECVASNDHTTFDAVVSGINFGVNIGGNNISSGTFSAAFRALHARLAPKAIALSLDIEPSMHGYNHNGVDSIDDYIEYPGKPALKLIDQILKYQWYDADCYNVNFPLKNLWNGKISLTEFIPETKGYWPFSIINKDTSTFFYPSEDHRKTDNDELYDAGAIMKGFISVSPLRSNMSSIECKKRLNIPPSRIFPL